MTIDLDALESAAKAATPGPWLDMARDIYSAVDAHIAYCPVVCSSAKEHCITQQQAKANAAYIAAVGPDVVLELIAEIRELQKKAKKECFIQKVEEEPDFTDSDAWGITREPSYDDNAAD